MLKYFLQGLMLGFAYVAPIGMQNLYVINTALSKSKTRGYQVAGITAFFDISLALACFWGIGALLKSNQMLKGIILLFGSVIVIFIGIRLILNVPKTQKVDVNKSLLEIITTCFMVTWVNPQAIIDGSLLLGGFRVSMPSDGLSLFIFGVCFASLSWFTGITTLVLIFKNSFNGRVIRAINIICGVIIIYYGIKLGFSYLHMMGFI